MFMNILLSRAVAAQFLQMAECILFFQPPATLIARAKAACECEAFSVGGGGTATPFGASSSQPHPQVVLEFMRLKGLGSPVEKNAFL
jgi:hypothetical protein